MWSKIPAPVQETIVKIALVAAAIGPILVVVGKIISAVGTIMTIIPQVSAAIGVVKGAMTALNATMLANLSFSSSLQLLPWLPFHLSLEHE